MFGFLKKKLADGIEKLKDSLKQKEELPAEAVQEAAQKVEDAIEAKKEIEYKEKLVEDAGYKLKPEVEQAITKPYEHTIAEAEEAVPEIEEELP
jgi:hypothetical protein